MELMNARSIFSRATGFIRRGGFDWTCNPYVGCTYGCLYCYAAFLPQNRRPLQDWGRWLIVKQNAISLAEKQAPRLAGHTVYMSSVTDPYLPVEQSLRLTRGILSVLVRVQPRLVVQTRGPLVVRDIDLLRQFRSLRVNVSIPTDSEEVRKRFEPKAPPLRSRWEAVRMLRMAGVPVGICVTPTLPLIDPDRFSDQLASFDDAVIVIQDFHDAGGRFGADTSPEAIRLREVCRWSSDDYANFRDLLRRKMMIYEGEAGFFPPPRTDDASDRGPVDPYETGRVV